MAKTKCICEDKGSGKKKKACKVNSKSELKNANVLSLYVCKDCQKQSISAKAICKPKEVSPSFVCQKCGSPSKKKKNLCKPAKSKIL
ncbi:MAG: hypothetical protein D3926_17580 [Desulfobacteraceae bacterium]|nr:MAG: hypothetical protein D3926_17580 [Desulfobacteraceae bacterium]